MTLKTTTFKNFAIRNVSEKKYCETFRVNVWERKYLSNNIHIFLESLMHLLRKKLQLKGNCSFDKYKISDKYLKEQFLKT